MDADASSPGQLDRISGKIARPLPRQVVGKFDIGSHSSTGSALRASASCLVSTTASSTSTMTRISTSNSEFQGFGWQQWKWALRTERLGVYQPLAWIILEAEFASFGLHPAGYHLVSIIFHVVNSVLLYVLTMALLARIDLLNPERSGARADLSAGVAVALFAAHPLRVEAVAWASAQPYLPCGGFALLSVSGLPCGPSGGGNGRRRGRLVVSDCALRHVVSVQGRDGRASARARNSRRLSPETALHRADCSRGSLRGWQSRRRRLSS